MYEIWNFSWEFSAWEFASTQNVNDDHSRYSKVGKFGKQNKNFVKELYV